MYILITKDDTVINISSWEQAEALVHSGKMLITVDHNGAHSVRVPVAGMDCTIERGYFEVLKWEHCHKREAILRKR